MSGGWDRPPQGREAWEEGPPSWLDDDAGSQWDGWEEPIPFDSFEVPVFPVDSLPSWMKHWSQEVAIAHQVPIDLPAMLSLSVV